MGNRIFNYDEANALLGEVRERTQEANDRLKALRSKLEGTTPGSPRATKLTEWVNTVIHEWAGAMTALGALPKGLWTVDFDSGKGYFYCWSLNESHLAYYHSYEEGFMGRKPLSDLVGEEAPVLLN